MTEIPANTPRPIGRTDSFFPGTAKVFAEGVAAALEEAESAAEDAPVEEDAAAAEVAEPFEEEPVELLPDDVAVADPVAGTVDKP